jgi:hypothetical protein
VYYIRLVVVDIRKKLNDPGHWIDSFGPWMQFGVAMDTCMVYELILGFQSRVVIVIVGAWLVASLNLCSGITRFVFQQGLPTPRNVSSPRLVSVLHWIDKADGGASLLEKLSTFGDEPSTEEPKRPCRQR